MHHTRTCCRGITRLGYDFHDECEFKKTFGAQPYMSYLCYSYGVLHALTVNHSIFFQYTCTSFLKIKAKGNVILCRFPILLYLEVKIK